MCASHFFVRLQTTTTDQGLSPSDFLHLQSPAGLGLCVWNACQDALTGQRSSSHRSGLVRTIPQRV